MFTESVDPLLCMEVDSETKFPPLKSLARSCTWDKDLPIPGKPRTTEAPRFAVPRPSVVLFCLEQTLVDLNHTFTRLSTRSQASREACLAWSQDSLEWALDVSQSRARSVSTSFHFLPA